jgi:hypothetical protein
MSRLLPGSKQNSLNSTAPKAHQKEKMQLGQKSKIWRKMVAGKRQVNHTTIDLAF